MRSIGIDASQMNRTALQMVDVQVPSAEVLLLNSVPKTIVPAQGAHRVIELVSAIGFLNYKTTAYASFGRLGLWETNTSGTQISGTLTLASFLAQTADIVKHMFPVYSATVGLTLDENVPLVLAADDGVPTAGDSPIKIRCYYRVHDTGFQY